MLDNIEFDFAFSFAGEDRDVVHEIYDKLNADGISVFYDLAYQSQLVGEDLYRGLRDLYKNKGKYIVCFISKHYAKKIWTTLEFTAIKERLMSTFFASDFLIPIIMDKTEMLEDIPLFIGFYEHHSVKETVAMLKMKINSSISEDHLITNINNCISYVCRQVHLRLQTNNINATLVHTDEIVINQNGYNTTYFFASNTITHTPCILVTKGEGISHCEIIQRTPFPSYIITWRKQERLLFSIHEFDGDDSSTVKGQPLNELVKYICSMIQKDIGRLIH